MKLLDFINNKTNNAYIDFKLVSVIFDEKSHDLIFKFLYKNEIKNEDKQILTNLIKQYINKDVNIIVKCKKAYIDCDLVREVVYNFIKKNFASVAVNLNKEQIKVEIANEIFVTINCNKFIYNYLSNSNVKKEILDYGEGFFFEPFNLEVKFIENGENIEEYTIDDNQSLLESIYNSSSENSIKSYKVENINNIIGEINGCPIEISSIKNTIENIEISGTIKFLTQKNFESKRIDKDGNNVIKTYYSFNIIDKTGRINCVCFPNKADLNKMLILKDDDYIIVRGNVEEFNGRLNLKVNSLAFCTRVDEDNVEDIIIKKEPNEKYKVVFPETYNEMIQSNLFEQSDNVGEYLLNNDVVVFDIETTGLEASKCEIIEIGAIKLKQGKKFETFETFVRPKGNIPEEITALTGITNNMVINAPNIENVIADFYKFCYNCTIIAYNIDFDYKFINLFGKKSSYIFDNKQIDALYLARAFIPGLKNFKLSTVCKKLGISLENAHRAVHDAMATADVVIKLSSHIT